MESLFDEVSALEMPDSSESTGLQPKQEGDQATAPGFQPSGGVASTTRALTHAVQSQYLATHKGEDRATADRREHRTAYMRAWRAANKEKYREARRASDWKYRFADREQFLETKRAWERNKRFRDREHCTEYRRKLRAKNRDTYLETKRAWERKYRAANKKKTRTKCCGKELRLAH